MSESLESLLKSRIGGLGEEPKPVFFDLSKEADQQRLQELLESDSSIGVIDTYESQLKELLTIEQPPLKMQPDVLQQELPKFIKQHYDGGRPEQAGRWVYLPWRNVVIHLLDDVLFQKVRTTRNRNLITAEEQEKFYNSTIGIAGQSVGNSVTLAIVLTGGGKHLRLADNDTLELSNLNRIRGSIAQITMPKVYMTAQHVYELDPYADITCFTDGLTEDNVEQFMDGLDVVVDEIDTIGMKVRIRQEAKKRRLPVVMAADNGDGGILDVERHDVEEDIPHFHGRAGDDIAERTVGKKLPLPVIGQIITEKLLGADNLTPRTQQSLLKIGSEIPTWPQLGGAAMLNGVAVAATVRRILTDQPVVDNRAVLSLESWLVPGYGEKQSVKKRAADTKEFLDNLHVLFAKKPE